MTPELALQRLLVGRGLAGFSFATCFSLRFECVKRDESVPWEVVLELDCDWRFGEPSEWAVHVERFAVAFHKNAEESLQAAALVRLRWGEESVVTEAVLGAEDLRITFGPPADARQLVIPRVRGDQSWRLFDASNRDSGWAVSQVADETFVRHPA